MLSTTDRKDIRPSDPLPWVTVAMFCLLFVLVGVVGAFLSGKIDRALQGNLNLGKYEVVANQDLENQNKQLLERAARLERANGELLNRVRAMGDTISRKNQEAAFQKERADQNQGFLLALGQSQRGMQNMLDSLNHRLSASMEEQRELNRMLDDTSRAQFLTRQIRDSFRGIRKVVTPDATYDIILFDDTTFVKSVQYNRIVQTAEVVYGPAHGPWGKREPVGIDVRTEHSNPNITPKKETQRLEFKAKNLDQPARPNLKRIKRPQSKVRRSLRTKLLAPTH